MPGGLLNLVAYGNQNVILNGTPSKTFFKTTYAKYTNFGLQKFRIDFTGQRILRLNEESKFSFKVPRYADLLMGTYVVVTLPTIWSPIYPPQDCSGEWAPYNFKWIENLGAQMIKEVVVSVGGQTLQRVSGNYLLAQVQRDFDDTQQSMYNQMTGNVAELNDPANALGRNGNYPNAAYVPPPAGPEPSIRGRKLYIPLNAWFMLTSQMAFPLVSLQYNELHIDVTFRPVREMCTIVAPDDDDRRDIQPNFNDSLQGFYRFLQPPPNDALTPYGDLRTNWNADIHLLSTFCFLAEEEVRVFAADEQKYLIKEVHEYTFPNVTGSHRVLLNSLGMVSSYMWFFRRSDINLRNQWSNYSNWEYGLPPSQIVLADVSGTIDLSYCDPFDPSNATLGPGLNPGGVDTGLYASGVFNINNHKSVMLNWCILLDGKYRENPMEWGVWSYVEKYTASKGDGPDGLYCYNFGLNTDLFSHQPSGALNMSKFQRVEFEFTTFTPPLDPSAQTFVICDPSSNEILGVNKPTWRIYDYNYDLIVLEERYNTVIFTSGNAGLMYARS